MKKKIMKYKIMNYAKLFFLLLKTDLIIFNKRFKEGIINTIIWVSIILVIFAYIFPAMGMTNLFGPLYVTGAVVSSCIFEIWSSSITFVSDLEANKTISYPLTLPIPSWLYFIQLAIGYAIKSMTIALVIIPLGKLIIWDKFSLAHISLTKTLIMFIIVNIFAGLLSLFMSSITTSIFNFRNIWTRFLFPLWFLGGAEFYWQVAYTLSKPLAYIMLLNPITYAMEGMRASILGEKLFISFWICSFMLFIFSILCGYVAFKKLKNRLDFV
jgi:ABC-2 type transport system permease protein